MPRRALPLAVVAVVLLAGCSGLAPPSDQATSSTQSPTETADCPPPENFAEKPLPDRPENLTKDRAVEFATAYEEATVWNELLPRADHHLSASTRGEVVTETEDGYIVFVDGSASYGRCVDSGTAHSDLFFDANYFVNESTAIRLTDIENKTTDPRTHGGDVVENET